MLNVIQHFSKYEHFIVYSFSKTKHMTISKNNLSILKVFAFCLLLSIAACESKTEKKAETAPVEAKDTLSKPLDTTAVPRPRQPGD